jgi:hypothetical protein
MQIMRRALFAGVMTLLWLVSLAQPASAHTVSGVGATNWKTTIIWLRPAVPGLAARVIEDGSRLELTNHGPEVVVLGYDGEPYLRVGPHGVFENTFSPATYLNCSRKGCPVSPIANPQAPPRWKQISSGQTARWHDHRTHWMGNRPPPDVRRTPGQVHQRPPWTISLVQGDTRIALTGRLTWVPGQNPGPWLLLALALAVLAAALGVFGYWGVPLAVLVAVLTINDFYHAIGIAWSFGGGFWTKFGKFFSGSFYSTIGWVLGVLAIWLLVRRRVDGLYAAVFAGISAALFTGLLDITVLSRSQAPFDGLIGVDQLTVAVSLGLGVGIATAAFIALRRVPRDSDAGDEDLGDEDLGDEWPGDDGGPVPDEGAVHDGAAGFATGH